MPGTSHRARHALGSTVVALSLALLAGALPYFGVRRPTTPGAPPGLVPARERRPSRVAPDHGEPYDARRAYGWVRDNQSGDPVSMTERRDGTVLPRTAHRHVHHHAAARRSGGAG